MDVVFVAWLVPGVILGDLSETEALKAHHKLGLGWLGGRALGAEDLDTLADVALAHRTNLRA